jgi:hypothetical protein
VQHRQLAVALHDHRAEHGALDRLEARHGTAA